jgi:hypothetical protein
MRLAHPQLPGLLEPQKEFVLQWPSTHTAIRYTL